MPEPLSMAVGALLFVAGWVAGRTARRRAAKPARGPEPVCTCRHGLAYHDRDTGLCCWRGLESRYSSTKGTYDVTVNCSCRRYVGPEPITDIWVPPALPADVNGSGQ